VFRAAHPLAGDDLTVGFLQSLGLDSLPASEEGVEVEQMSPGRAVSVLFCTASGGESVEGVAPLTGCCWWLSFAAVLAATDMD
jgi:hypothetical protein